MTCIAVLIHYHTENKFGSKIPIAAILLITCIQSISVPTLLFSQTDAMKSNVPSMYYPNYTGVRFEKNLNTFFWNLGAQYDYRSIDYLFSFSNQFTSSLIQHNQHSVRDEESFSADLKRRLHDKVWVTADFSSFVLSDNQSLGMSNAAVHTGAVGLMMKPVDGISISPAIGRRYDRQEEESDEGIYYKALVDVDTVDISGYTASVSGKWNSANLSPREFKNSSAQLVIKKEFSEGSADSIRIRWSQNRWDFYIPADQYVKAEYGVNSNIRLRSEDIFFINNTLAYGMGEDLSLLFKSGMSTRSITNAYHYQSFRQLPAIPFATTVYELQLDGSIDLEFRLSEMGRALIGIVASERDERHLFGHIEGIDKDFQESRARQERRLDNIAQRFAVRSFADLPLTASDRIVLEGYSGILRYDTPDSLNYDDRDELLITGAVTASHIFNATMEFAVRAEATLAHNVYLFKERSANNNWNRIFRLSPSVTYASRSGFSTNFRAEVMANYTVFDFGSLVQSVKSYSFRQVAFVDSTSYDISNRFSADMFFHLRFYEHGELFWERFSEQPQEYTEELTFFPQLRYRLDETAVFAIGFRSYMQNKYRYSGEKKKYENDYFSFGPTASISVMLSPSSRLEFQGWKEFQQQSGQKGQELSNVTLNLKLFL